MLILTPDGLIAARDRYGRTPLIIGKKEDSYAVASESCSFRNLGFEECYSLGPGEAVLLTADAYKTIVKSGKTLEICSFLWIYYGYPASSYEGINVDNVRHSLGRIMGESDNTQIDMASAIPDSGTCMAIGYAEGKKVPYRSAIVKYTPTWPRSFTPSDQSVRDLVAKMKLIPIHDLIEGKSLLLIDDSIVRGTQLRETTEYLFESGAKEVHIRPACPPLFYGCKYLNFSRSTSEMDLITRRVIKKLEGVEPTDEIIKEYVDPDGEKYAAMIEEIRKELHFTTLRYHRLDDMIASVGIDSDKLCTYCWDGKE